MAHSSLLTWRIPWTIYSPWGRKELDETGQLSLSLQHDIICDDLMRIILDEKRAEEH